MVLLFFCRRLQCLVWRPNSKLSEAGKKYSRGDGGQKYGRGHLETVEMLMEVLEVMEVLVEVTMRIIQDGE